jgi:hypothetical protein
MLQTSIIIISFLSLTIVEFGENELKIILFSFYFVVEQQQQQTTTKNFFFYGAAGGVGFVDDAAGGGGATAAAAAARATSRCALAANRCASPGVAVMESINTSNCAMHPSSVGGSFVYVGGAGGVGGEDCRPYKKKKTVYDRWLNIHLSILFRILTFNSSVYERHMIKKIPHKISVYIYIYDAKTKR